MKKLLASLLAFIVIGITLNVVGILPGSEVESRDPSSTEEPATSDLPIINISKGDYAPIEIDNSTSFSSSWYSVITEGSMELSGEYNKQIAKISSTGSSKSSLQVMHDGIHLMKGDSYTLTAQVISSVDRTIDVIFANADNGEVHFSEQVSVGNETPIQINLIMSKDSNWNGRIQFNLGNESKIKDHTISIENIRLVNNSTNDNSIRVNHLGYLTLNQKRFVATYNQGDMFDVINTATNEIVYTGAMLNKLDNTLTGENNSFGDFTNVMEDGTYLIRAQLGGMSYSFNINNDIYNQIERDLVKMLTFQRCAYELDASWAGKLAHRACHDGLAIIYDDQTQVMDVNGGWHDAGDFGRYVKTGTKTVYDLLFAYKSNPAKFADDLGIPESGNQVPDILDEARFEIEWLLKMQTSWGGVYSKAITQGIPEDIAPEDDTQRTYVLSEETVTTGEFIAVMALAYDIYKDVDGAFADSCLKAAIKSMDYLMATPNFIEYLNPSDIIGGEYRDDQDSDERFYAGMALWNATNDEKYLDYAETILSGSDHAAIGTSWRDVGGYGAYLFLTNEKAKEHKTLYNKVSKLFKAQADDLLTVVSVDGYLTSLTSYGWGSNGFVAYNGILLSMAYDVFGDQRYQQAAVEQVNYILGKNSLNRTFVSGYGKDSPVNMHSRLYKIKGSIIPGVLVGGANSDREDPITKNLAENTAPTKIYSDQYLSYSSNEISIYWNGALVHLLSKIQ